MKFGSRLVTADRGGQKNCNGKMIVVFFAMFSTSATTMFNNLNVTYIICKRVTIKYRDFGMSSILIVNMALFGNTSNFQGQLSFRFRI